MSLFYIFLHPAWVHRPHFGGHKTSPYNEDDEPPAGGSLDSRTTVFYPSSSGHFADVYHWPQGP